MKAKFTDRVTNTIRVNTRAKLSKRIGRGVASLLWFAMGASKDEATLHLMRIGFFRRRPR